MAAVRTSLAGQPPTRQSETSTSDNPETKQLQDQLAKLEGDLVLAQVKFTEKNRKVRDLKAQVSDIRDRLSKQVGRMITQRTITANPTHEKLAEELVDLTSQQASLRGRLDALGTAIGENEQRAGQLADTSVVLIARTREYDNAQARYEQLQAALNQAKLEEQVSSDTSEIYVADEAKSAVGPVTRSGPSVLQLLLLGLVLGLGLAVGTVLALEFMDDRVQDRESLWRELDIPVSAVIPQLAEVNGVPLARITELLPLSPHAESYRFLRTEMMHHDGLSRLRTVLVATARPGQGGSTTAANLAISLAEAGKHVVLVDADLRRPVLHHFFETDNDAGLTSLLTNGGGAVANALRRTSIENLLLLPAGPDVPNPAALLTSERMKTVIARLREHSDYVVFDAPSAAAFSDAAVLGAQLDGVIMVVRANQPVREVERQTKSLFAKVGANVVGAVLNDARPQDVDSYYFHQHYYNRYPLPPGPNGGGTSAASTVAPVSSPVAHQLPAAEPSTGSTPVTQVAVPGRPTFARRWQSRPAAHRLAIAIISAALVLGLGYLGISSHRAPRRGAARSSAAPLAAQSSGGAVTVLAMVKAPTNARVESDGRLLYDGPLSAGQQIWRGDHDVTVWADQPEAIEVTVNGKPGGALGKQGDPPTSRRFVSQSADSTGAKP